MNQLAVARLATVVNTPGLFLGRFSVIKTKSSWQNLEFVDNFLEFFLKNLEFFSSSLSFPGILEFSFFTFIVYQFLH